MYLLRLRIICLVCSAGRKSQNTRSFVNGVIQVKQLTEILYGNTDAERCYNIAFLVYGVPVEVQRNAVFGDASFLDTPILHAGNQCP